MENIKILLNEQEIKERIMELAKEINKKFNNEEVIAICSLKGAVLFFSDLIRHLTMPINLEFLEISSYGNETSSKGEIKIIKDINISLDGKNVLFIEDIIDSGRTLEFIKSLIIKQNPKNFFTCVLLDNPARRINQIDADFVGFKIPNKFVIGYGLDYMQKYRNLPYVGYIE